MIDATSQLEATPLQSGEVFRHRDPSGVSGRGVVAQIVQFSNGKVVVGWLGEYPTTEQLDNLEHFFAVHGHNGATVIYWNSGEVQENAETAHCFASSP